MNTSLNTRHFFNSKTISHSKYVQIFQEITLLAHCSFFLTLSVNNSKRGGYISIDFCFAIVPSAAVLVLCAGKNSQYQILKTSVL